MSKLKWVLLQLARRLWVRATLIGLLGVVAAILSAFAEPFVPWSVPGTIGAEAVDGILTIIASSMLAVTTFSLSVMTSAYGSATSNVTPRATRLLMQDRVTQNVLSTFIGSFLFSIVGLVVLKTGLYGPRGRVILFAVTVAVILLIVVTLLRWIDHLTRLGRVGETTDRVEQAARDAIEARHAMPCLGARPRHGDAPDPAEGRPVAAAVTGYVQHVDMTALAKASERLDADIVLGAIPGAFVYEGTPLAWCLPSAKGDADEVGEIDDAIRKAFSIGTERSFDQDPRFGIVVLSEIAMRALSPGINDPGTAIDVIGRVARLLILWGKPPAEAASEPEHPRIHVPALAIEDMFDDAFRPIARDGAGNLEVQLRLQKALRALGRLGDARFRAAAHHQSALALARAEAAMTLEDDKARLRTVALAD